MPDDANLSCPFCGGSVNPDGWLRNDGVRGPECNECGTTAPSLKVWNEQTLLGQLTDERMEHNLLKELLSRPEIDDFWEGIVTEAAHQRQRWGDAHDRDKSAENWFWLVGYLSGKALRASIEGDKAKAKHHTISTAAALFQWHQAIKADETGSGRGKDEDIDPEAGRLSAEPQ